MEPVVDNYHGMEIIDHYRYLEDASTSQTKAWLDAQSHTTQTFFEALPFFQQIKDDVSNLWSYASYTLPQVRQSRYFFRHTDSHQQDRLLMQEDFQHDPICLFDFKALDQTLSSFSLNTQGTVMAYGLSKSDWQELHFHRLFVNETDPSISIEEVLLGTRASGTLVWHKEGLYYSRYPLPGSSAPEERIRSNQIYFHKLGTSQTEDHLIFEADKNDRRFHVRGTDDERFLLIQETQGTGANTRWFYRAMESNEPFVSLIDEADALYEFLGNDEVYFYFMTTLNAPRKRIIGIPVETPENAPWKEVLPQQADVIHHALLISGMFVVVWMQDLHPVLTFYDRDGRVLHTLTLPLGSVRGLSRADQDVFLSFSSFLCPETIYRYALKTQTLEVFQQATNSFDASSYTVSQKWYPSKDGTSIPLLVLHKKELVLDKHTPTLLVGYGGFGLSQWPSFSTPARYWIEHGGIYALALVRGGGEYGEQWHRAGMLEKKQNSFDDFISAAEYLCAQGYTSPPRLAINGWSSGGLLVAACLQRPDLWGAVICCSPLTDMLRYQRPELGVGYYWTKEFGDAEKNIEHFHILRAYSPFHQAQTQVQAYPPTLIMAGDLDDRISPSHARKFAAALQRSNSGQAPILFHGQSEAGHRGKVTEQWGIIFSFLFHFFDMKP